MFQSLLWIQRGVCVQLKMASLCGIPFPGQKSALQDVAGQVYPRLTFLGFSQLYKNCSVEDDQDII